MIDGIPLKVLIIDPDNKSANALKSVLDSVEYVISANIENTVNEIEMIIKENDINAIFIDPITLGIENASNFIFDLRKRYPSIVFVLFMDFQKQNDLGHTFFSGERQRFRHYYKLDKRSKSSRFRARVLFSLDECQIYLSYSLEKKKIINLKNELFEIQKNANKKNDTVTIPIDILEQIKVQLNERQHETEQLGHKEKNASFLGLPLKNKNSNDCFVIMPYSQPWSSAVEEVIKEICKDVGFDFKIAKMMKGRYVPHDIWRGITGAKCIVADITGANANVAYEIGLADAIGRELVLISQDEDVPFDFLGQRLIVYKDSVAGSLKLRKNLYDRLESFKE